MRITKIGNFSLIKVIDNHLKLILVTHGTLFWKNRLRKPAYAKINHVGTSKNPLFRHQPSGKSGRIPRFLEVPMRNLLSELGDIKSRISLVNNCWSCCYWKAEFSGFVHSKFELDESKNNPLCLSP